MSLPAALSAVPTAAHAGRFFQAGVLGITAAVMAHRHAVRATSHANPSPWAPK
jgi:hypothetical protein